MKVPSMKVMSNYCQIQKLTHSVALPDILSNDSANITGYSFIPLQLLFWILGQTFRNVLERCISHPRIPGFSTMEEKCFSF
jgi:hypothetical protein